MTTPDPVELREARTFVLRRTEDASGVSGTGDVAEGVVFSDGTTVLRWNRAGGSTAVYDSLDRMEAIHGHDGRTKVVFAALAASPAPEPTGLDAAWAEAARRAPGSWIGVERDDHGLFRATAWTNGARSGTAIGTIGSFGDEAAALRALAARLAGEGS